MEVNGKTVKVLYECGDAKKYNRDGCRCEPCTRASRIERERRKISRSRHGVALVPTKPVRKQVKQLYMVGWNFERMAKEARVGSSTLRRVYHDAGGPTVHRRVAESVSRLWNDVFCDGELFDPAHPRRFKLSKRGTARWDRTKISDALKRRYGHYECITPEDKDELSMKNLASTPLAEKLALKHGFMPWEVWEDWSDRVS